MLEERICLLANELRWSQQNKKRQRLNGVENRLNVKWF